MPAISPSSVGLAGTAGAEQGQEFAFVHIEIDPVERDRASIRLGEGHGPVISGSWLSFR